MSDNSRLVKDLQEARRFLRGDILKGKVQFRCAGPKCPVETVTLSFAELIGDSRPMQPPCRCPRCAQALEYISFSY
jgi:hypothetical protein